MADDVGSLGGERSIGTVEVKASQGLRVLLVEDDAVDVLGVRRAVARSDAEIELSIARDGSEALAFLGAAARLPDLMVLDLNLPGLTGLEILRRIRADEDLSPLPVFVLSTSDDPQDVLAARRMHVVGFVSKSRLRGEYERLVRILVDLFDLVESASGGE